MTEILKLTNKINRLEEAFSQLQMLLDRRNTQFVTIKKDNEKYLKYLKEIKRQCKKDLKLTEPEAGYNPFAGGRYYEAELIFDIVNKGLK